MKNSFATNIVRLGFLAWLTFELLNWAKIMHFSLDFTWSGLIITCGIIWLAIEVISARVNKSTGRPLPWFVFLGALISVSIDAFGDVAHLYSHFYWYDQMAHAMGGGMVALLAFFVYWQVVESGKIKIGRKFTGFIAVLTAMSLGVIYELEEYLEDVFTGSNRLGDGWDTANDMMWNTIGAIVVILIVMWLVRGRKEDIKIKNIDQFK